jgi:tetratricopeptide (TPR) repeat protein
MTNKLLLLSLLLLLASCRSSNPILPPTLVTHTGKLQRLANSGHDLDPLSHQQRLQVGIEGDRLYQQARQAYLAGDYGTYVYKLNQSRKRFSMLATPFAEQLSTLNELLDHGNVLWAQQLSKQAEAQLADGSYEKAIESFRQAALADPSQAAAIHQRTAVVATARQHARWNNLGRYGISTEQ